MIIEDEAQIRYALRRYLESNGYQVREAEDGTTALREFELFKPDVMLLDLMLPDLSGVDIVRELRQTHETPIERFERGGPHRGRIRCVHSTRLSPCHWRSTRPGTGTASAGYC